MAGDDLRKGAIAVAEQTRAGGTTRNCCWSTCSTSSNPPLNEECDDDFQSDANGDGCAASGQSRVAAPRELDEPLQISRWALAAC
jgi:hypothetical protein